MKKSSLYSIIAILFIVSGASGLVYQIVWFKYLSLFLGNTTYAQTVVLATFMGGLAIGASLWGRKSDSSRNPLRLYAILEILIGIYCLLYPFLISSLKGVFISIAQGANLASDSFGVLILKLLISVVTLLLPTILMGGTLPVLVRFLSKSINESGKNVALLYFLNSFGAVVGSMLGGFFLVPLVGLKGTIIAAGVINIGVGVIALLISKLQMAAREELDQAESEETTYSERQITLAILVAGLSGLASMIYEVTWLRLLIPILGSSTYSYTLLLIAFISGITIGSLIVSKIIHKVKNLFNLLTSCQFAIGISMVMSLPLYGYVPYAFWHVGYALNRTEATYPIFLTLQFFVGFLIMIVPTIFLGMSLPIASRIATSDIKILGRMVGTVFSINTLGTVLGSLAGGLILIPLIGVRHSIEVGLLINILSGVLLLFHDPRISIKRRKFQTTSIITAVLIFIYLTADWNQIVTLSGVFRNLTRKSAPPASYTEFVNTIRRNKIVYYKEGTMATVGVLQEGTPIDFQNVLIINGKADASSTVDLPTQVLLGQIPMMIHPKPDSVMVIGFGSGATIGSILTHPVKSVQTVEISAEVIDASKHFEHVNGKPLSDPRSKIFIDDALSFLKLSNSSYDVIVSEPSNPWIAGIGSLYTIEFFQECKTRMKPNGLMVQWFYLYEMDDETFRLVVRTFSSVFPNTSLWYSLTKDVILIGSNEPIEITEEELQKKISIPAVRDDLRRLHVNDVATFLSLQAISERGLSEYANYGEFNTEDKPLLEYRAPKAFYINAGVTKLNAYDERWRFDDSPTAFKKLLRRRALTEEEALNLIRYHTLSDRGGAPIGYSLLVQYLQAHPQDTASLKQMVDLCDRLEKKEEGLIYLQRLVELSPHDPVVLEKYVWKKFISLRNLSSPVQPFDTTASVQLLKECIRLTKDSVDYYFSKLGDYYFHLQQFKQAAVYYEKALKMNEDRENVSRIQLDRLLLNLAICWNEMGNEGYALSFATQASRLNPNNTEAKDYAFYIFIKGSKKNRQAQR
ncbi:MAG: fused MFS/spermidine synthase [bacterium]